MKKFYKIIAIVVVILLGVFSALQGSIIVKENEGQEVLNSTSWRAATKKMAYAAYDEGENYAGFSGYVDIDEVFKTDLISTYAFSKLLYCTGEEINKPEKDRISTFCLNNIKNYLNNPAENSVLNKKEGCCKEEWIYTNLSLMNKKDIGLVKDQIYQKVNLLYEKRKQALAATDKNDTVYKSIVPILYAYKTFHLLGQFPNNMNEDKLYFLKLLNDDKFFHSPLSEEGPETIGFVIIQCLEELSVPQDAVSANILDSRKKWFNEQLNYIQHNIKNPIFAGIAMFEASKAAPFFNEKIALEDSFVRKICDNELYKGGWATVPGVAVCSPIATYSIICLLKETGNLNKRDREKAENLLKSIKKLERDNGFSRPYGLDIDIVSTYYGLKVWKEIPFTINTEKILNYLTDNCVSYIKEINNITYKLKEMEHEKFSEELEEKAEGLTAKALYDTKELYYIKQSMNLLGDHSFDNKIKIAVSALAKPEPFSMGDSELPPNRLTLSEFFCMFKLANEDCFTVMGKFQSLGSLYDFSKPCSRYEFYKKYWGKQISRYNVLDALPPDRLEIPDIYYLVSILSKCQEAYHNERASGIIKFHSFYISTMERLKEYGGIDIYQKKVASLRSIIFGGYKRTNEVRIPDMDDTYFAVQTLSMLNVSFSKRDIKKFLLLSVSHYGGFTVVPYSKMKGDLKSTAEGLELLNWCNSN